MEERDDAAIITCIKQQLSIILRFAANYNPLLVPFENDGSSLVVHSRITLYFVYFESMIK